MTTQTSLSLSLARHALGRAALRMPGWTVTAGEDPRNGNLIISARTDWAGRPATLAALARTTQASRARRRVLEVMSARRTIAIIVRDASRVAAVRTRRAPALVGSIAQSRQWSVGEIDAAINVAITSEADAYAAYLAALAAAADPDGVARRQAQASYSASSRLAELADSLRGTRHEAEARRIADEWTGETDPEGRIKKLKRLARAMEA